ncbi:hypothetical protein [Streptomyces marokkonensis]|uniref:hypothetical protein n=1 Tax=Streptomyces marokkonensis TaxID=324855 RepID=UPI0011F2154A|nr:hypothetical protein [Streptomyces marokkonensis]
MTEMLDAAWREVEGIADDRQWEHLADLSRGTHPAEALAVCPRLGERLREPTGDRAYERLARLLLGAHVCHRVPGTQKPFTEHLRRPARN